MVLRYDVGRLAKAEITGSGGARVPAIVSRAGVLKYFTEDGKEVLELRPDDEVFHADSLASLEHATVTVSHHGAIDSGNWRKHSVGFVATAGKRSADLVSAPLVVQHGETLARVDSGELSECSSGYGCRIDETPGVDPVHGRYDRIQRDIRYNHVALLPAGQGRAGARVSLRLDSSGNQVTGGTVAQQENTQMLKYTLDGVQFETGTPQFIQALDKHLEANAAELANVRADAEAVKLQAATDVKAATDRADGAEATLKAAKADVDALVALRVDAIGTLGEDFEFEGLDQADIQRAVLTKLGVEVPADASPDFIAGAYAARPAPEAKEDSKQDVKRDDAGASKIASGLLGGSNAYKDDPPAHPPGLGPILASA